MGRNQLDVVFANGSGPRDVDAVELAMLERRLPVLRVASPANGEPGGLRAARLAAI